MNILPLRNVIRKEDHASLRNAVWAATLRACRAHVPGVSMRTVKSMSQCILITGVFEAARMLGAETAWVLPGEALDAERECVHWVWIAPCTRTGAVTSIGLYYVDVCAAATAMEVARHIVAGDMMADARPDLPDAARAMILHAPPPPVDASAAPRALPGVAIPVDASPAAPSPPPVRRASSSPPWPLPTPQPPVLVRPVRAGALDPAFPMPAFARHTVSLDVCVAVQREIRRHIETGERLSRDTTMLLHVLGVPPPIECGCWEMQLHADAFEATCRHIAQVYEEALSTAYTHSDVVKGALRAAVGKIAPPHRCRGMRARSDSL